MTGPRRLKPFAPAEPLAGSAGADATAQFADRARATLAAGFAPLGQTGWTASRVGFGCYRVGWENPEHAQALAMALAGGVNLIDTSANYMDGASEETAGSVLGQMVQAGSMTRDQVVVVTKAGYVQGSNMRVVQERQAAGRPFPDVVEYADGCWHCVHPEFLADQIARSLSRLRLERLDCLLLHNPEYFLSAAEKHGRVGDAEREEYDRRIRAAFESLEKQVAAGAIGCYGVSSNTFPTPASDPEHTSLSRCWDIAREVGGEGHHFRVVQMPGNLLERGFAEEPNQPGGQTPAQFVAERGLGLLLNRPLNAFGQSGGLTRLADVPESAEKTTEEQWRLAIADLREREREAQKLLSGNSPIEAEARRLLRHGTLLSENWRSIHDREHWKQVVEQQLVPMAQYGLAALRAALEERGERNGGSGEMAQRYLAALNAVMRRGFAWFSEGARIEAARRRERLFAVLRPEEANALRDATLSQIAIRALLAQAGTPFVLVGMRHATYVKDVLDCFKSPMADANFAHDILGRLGRALEQEA
jgi:aryl-alcohol dehydrogenase-like predicted oxidoreductase